MISPSVCLDPLKSSNYGNIGFTSGGSRVFLRWGSNSESGCANLYSPVMFMFSQVSVCLWGVCPIAYWNTHPLGPEADTPPRQTSPGQNGQTHPLGRHTPPGQTPPGQTPPWADTPLGSTPPWADIRCPVHAGIHPPLLCSACWGTVNKRVVCIPLECILVLQCFCRKLHENERIWTGGASIALLDPPMFTFALMQISS